MTGFSLTKCASILLQLELIWLVLSSNLVHLLFHKLSFFYVQYNVYYEFLQTI